MSFMLSVGKKLYQMGAIIMNVVMLSVIILSVVAPPYTVVKSFL
jgi:hypothetical protein